MEDSIIEVPSGIINQLYEGEHIDFNVFKELNIDMSLYPNNGYLCLRNGTSQSALAHLKNETVRIVRSRAIKDIKPLNLEQKYLAHSLLDTDIQMVTVIGPAGSGKTLLTLAAAIDQTFIQKKYKKIVLTKPRTQVTDDEDPMGEVPGSMIEKMSPQLLSYEAAMRKIWGPKFTTYWEQMINNGTIEVIPLEHMRGIDLSDSFVICDEAQNAGSRQYKTLGTRMNASSKLVCLGDIEQVDRKHIQDIPLLKIGKHQFYTESDLTSFIELTQVERGPLVQLIVNIMKDYE